MGIWASQLNGLGVTAVTVGAGGKFSTLSDACTWITSQTRFTQIAQYTANVTGTSSGTVDVRSIVAASGSPLTNYRGRELAVSIGASTFKFKAKAMSATALITNAPIYADQSGVTVTVYSYTPSVIFLLPGTQLQLTSTIQVIPPFTTVVAHPRTASIQMMDNASFLRANDTDSNEIHFIGVDIFSYNGTGIGNILLPAYTSPGWEMLGQFSFKDCSILSGHVDNIMFTSSTNGFAMSGSVAGGCVFDNCLIQGFYDAIRAQVHRELIIRNCRITAFGQSSADVQQACVALGAAAAPGAYPRYDHIIHNNTMDALVITSGTTSSNCNPIEIRNYLSAACNVSIKNNYLRSWVMTNESIPAYAVAATQTDDVTTSPYIEAVNNTTDVAQKGGGAGTVKVFDSAVANYVVKRAGNSAALGSSTTLGANTTAITTF